MKDLKFKILEIKKNSEYKNALGKGQTKKIITLILLWDGRKIKEGLK